MNELSVRLQRFYQDLGVLREDALPRLRDYFSDDIHFIDPVRETRGMAELTELFRRMFNRYSRVGFANFVIGGEGDEFTMRYDMRMQMRFGPVFTTQMVSVCRVRDGKVHELADYYDLAGSLVSPFPLLNSAYRRVVVELLL